MSRFHRWPPLAVSSLTHNLHTLRDVVVDEERALEPEVRAWLARLLVVRAAGYIEQAVMECCRAHVKSRGGGWVQSFAHSWLERSKNPNSDNLIELVGRFDQTASDELDQLFRADDEALYRDLASMVDKRNKIAHGLNEGIGPERAVDLARTAETIVDWFVMKFNPDR